MWNSVGRLSFLPSLNLSLRSRFRGIHPIARCMSQGVFRTDSRPGPDRALTSRYVTSVAGLYLQPFGVRSMSSSGSGWYESVADSAPVHFTEQLLISSQQMTTLPWWAGIICTTVVLRSIITLPLAIYQATIIAKIEAVQKEIAELAHRLRYEISVRAKEKGWSEKMCRYHFKKNLRRIVSELYVRDNCHPFKASLLVWVQLPMWVCVSLSLRNLSVGLEHVLAGLQQQLAAGGALWFPDLTIPDSTWIIPVSLGLINLLITESMALYWLSSSCIGLAHNLLLRSPRFRSLCRIPPSRSDSPTPYRDIAAAFVTKYIK